MFVKLFIYFWDFTFNMKHGIKYSATKEIVVFCTLR